MCPAIDTSRVSALMGLMMNKSRQNTLMLPRSWTPVADHEGRRTSSASTKDERHQPDPSSAPDFLKMAANDHMDQSQSGCAERIQITICTCPSLRCHSVKASDGCRDAETNLLNIRWR